MGLNFHSTSIQISCDIRNFVRRGEKWWCFHLFFLINVENCALSPMCRRYLSSLFKSTLSDFCDSVKRSCNFREEVNYDSSKNDCVGG